MLVPAHLGISSGWVRMVEWREMFDKTLNVDVLCADL